MNASIRPDGPPRVALVLGAGGSVGHAFHLGVLGALADELRWDPRTASLIVGTSAGSIVGAGLRSGFAVHDLQRRSLGEPVSSEAREMSDRAHAAIARAMRAQEAASADRRTSDSAAPGRGALPRPASPERLLRALREPWRAAPGTLLSAAIPPGTRPTEHLGAPYDEFFGSEWTPEPLWVVASALDRGTRVVFGRDPGPTAAASVGLAVQASCAVPGYFAPVTIGDTRYVDGGVHSTTNADLVAGDLTGAAPFADGGRPDLVIVIAPMSPEQVGLDWSARAAVRQFARRWLTAELQTLDAAGLPSVVFQPSPDDLVEMAGNTMDRSKAPAIIERAATSTRARLDQPDVTSVLEPLGH